MSPWYSSCSNMVSYCKFNIIIEFIILYLKSICIMQMWKKYIRGFISCSPWAPTNFSISSLNSEFSIYLNIKTQWIFRFMFFVVKFPLWDFQSKIVTPPVDLAYKTIIYRSNTNSYDTTYSIFWSNPAVVQP